MAFMAVIVVSSLATETVDSCISEREKLFYKAHVMTQQFMVKS